MAPMQETPHQDSSHTPTPGMPPEGLGPWRGSLGSLDPRPLWPGRDSSHAEYPYSHQSQSGCLEIRKRNMILIFIQGDNHTDGLE